MLVLDLVIYESVLRNYYIHKYHMNGTDAKLTFLLQLVPPQPSLGNLEPLDYPLEPVQHTPEPSPINLSPPTNIE